MAGNLPATPPVCNYEGSDYQDSFWGRGGRAYEDACEAIALSRLLPAGGSQMLELGAGAGRNTPRYTGFEHITLVDYSTTQLSQARARLGDSKRFTYVAADIYRLPFADGQFDAATMIRTLHHMADAPAALAQVRGTLRLGAVFILEYANKQNLKAILRRLLRRQAWDPFSLEPVEFAELNFDFHPKAVANWLAAAGFRAERQRTVSHFRLGLLKRLVPPRLLAAADRLFQPTGNLWQLTPSVFVRAVAVGGLPAPSAPADGLPRFKCPACGHAPLDSRPATLDCPSCDRRWAFRDGIYDFREPASNGNPIIPQP